MLQMHALALWLSIILAHPPIAPELLNIKVVLASMKYPTHVLTADSPFINNPEDKIIVARSIEHKYFERQLFSPFKTFGRGLLLMQKGFRAGMFQDSLILQHIPAIVEYNNIILKKEDGPYPHLFRIISDEKCMSLAPNYRESGTYIPRFQKCEISREDQIWKMFTDARALAYLTDTKNYIDDMNESLSILIDEIDDYGRDILEK